MHNVELSWAIIKPSRAQHSQVLVTFLGARASAKPRIFDNAARAEEAESTAESLHVYKIEIPLNINYSINFCHMMPYTEVT